MLKMPTEYHNEMTALQERLDDLRHKKINLQEQLRLVDCQLDDTEQSLYNLDAKLCAVFWETQLKEPRYA